MHRERIFGLDVMRAAAILLVVYWHNADVLSWFLPAVPRLPVIDGVDLFFVLSGYLIGDILLRYAAMDQLPWRHRLFDFWQRRWLRTLPNYYLFLAINIALVHYGLANGLLNHNTWGYAFFLQNVWKPVDLFFWESWSLVVEEWYYLLFPILFFGALALVRAPARWVFLFVTALLIVASTVIRYGMLDEVGSVFELEESVRKLVITRMDILGFGMLGAWLAAGFPAAWRRWRLLLLLLGLAGMVVNAMAYGNEHLRYSCTIYFTLNAVSMTALLPVLSTWSGVPSWGRPLVFISLVSYALYLVHQPVRALYGRLYWDRSPGEGILLWLGYWAMCIILSWLVYRFWERRFMAMRDRIGRRIVRAAKAPSS